MTSVTERRKAECLRENRLKLAINEDQAETLRMLERVGWLIRFVRKQPGGRTVAGVYDPEKQSLALIEPDGTLNENPGLALRH